MQMSEIRQAGLCELMMCHLRSTEEEEGLGIAQILGEPNLNNKNSAELVR